MEEEEEAVEIIRYKYIIIICLYNPLKSIHRCFYFNSKIQNSLSRNELSLHYIHLVMEATRSIIRMQLRSIKH